MKTILLVDDDSNGGRGLAALLADAGYQVVLAADGAEALTRMRAEPPSLVLLDMVMGGMDGWRFLKEKRNDSSIQPIPVIILTALEVASEEWARMLGAVGFFKKPIAIDGLLEVVGPLTAARPHEPA